MKGDEKERERKKWSGCRISMEYKKKLWNVKHDSFMGSDEYRKAVANTKSMSFSELKMEALILYGIIGIIINLQRKEKQENIPGRIFLKIYLLFMNAQNHKSTS